MTTTILALALRILSNPMGNVFQKKLTGAGSHPLMVNFLTFFVLSLVCLAPASQQDWSCVPRQCWAYGITGGVFGAVGNGFLVKALQGGDLSILGPINSYKSVVGVVIGMIKRCLFYRFRRRYIRISQTEIVNILRSIDGSQSFAFLKHGTDR